MATPNAVFAVHYSCARGVRKAVALVKKNQVAQTEIFPKIIVLGARLRAWH